LTPRSRESREASENRISLAMGRGAQAHSITHFPTQHLVATMPAG